VELLLFSCLAGRLIFLHGKREKRGCVLRYARKVLRN